MGTPENTYWIFFSILYCIRSRRWKILFRTVYVHCYHLMIMEGRCRCRYKNKFISAKYYVNIYFWYHWCVRDNFWRLKAHEVYEAKLLVIFCYNKNMGDSFNVYRSPHLFWSFTFTRSNWKTRVCYEFFGSADLIKF